MCEPNEWVWVGSVHATFQAESYDTIEQAEQRIARIAEMDPVGVERGDYYIDVPEHMQPKRGHDA